MARLTEIQKRQRQEFTTGTVGQAFKRESHIPQFEKLLTRLGITEDNCTTDRELCSWVRANRNTRYVPEKVLRALRCHTLFDDGDFATYSLSEPGVVVELDVIEEIEEVGDESQIQKAA